MVLCENCGDKLYIEVYDFEEYSYMINGEPFCSDCFFDEVGEDYACFDLDDWDDNDY
jgi:hypothetical protein